MPPGYPDDIYPLSMESKRIFCAYHETQFLTNFCLQKQCLMPLCPSCIAEHTQQHFQQGKKPSYIIINEALSKAKQSCYCTIITLQEYKKLNEDVFQYISTLQQNIHAQLVAKRDHIFDLMTQMFVDYQYRLIKQIHEKYLQNNAYSIDQSLNASKFIDEEISNLYQKISMLKGQDCLSSLITYYAVDQKNYKEALSEFDEYFQKNRKTGKLQISILEENLDKLTTNFCDSILAVESVIQNYQRKTEQPLQNQFLKSKRYGFNKTSNKSQVKVSRRTIFDKQNQVSNRNKPQLKSSGKQQTISIGSKQNQEMGLNGKNQADQKKGGNIIKNINQSIPHDNMSRRKSLIQSPNVQKYQSKRLTRGFKKQI